MRRFALVMMLAGALSGLSGCFTMDAEHNRHHWEIIKTDIREWHSDLDFLLGLDKPTMLQSNIR